ncbi:MAG: Bug family tripartite tricarboxylate transporter substrate binding protein [Hyphomicrobiaceae bacterium]
MRRAVMLLAAVLAIAAYQPAVAQDYPSKQIKLVVPYPPGGPTDVMARKLGEQLQVLWGQPVIVENRAGANGNIAAQLVAKAAPDGYTIILHSSSMVINPLLYKAVGYDPFTEFVPISLVFDYKLMVVVHPSLPVTSLAELVAAAKAKPGQISYASAGGVGAPTHLAVEMFKQIAGIDVLHVPYAGGAPAVSDLLGGHVQLMFNNPTQSLPHIKAGKLRALATTGSNRMEQAPELPTVAELGYPGFDVGTWFALWGPAGVPAPIVDKLSAAVAAITRKPDVKVMLLGQGMTVIGSTPAELATYQKLEAERWGVVIKAANIKLE